MNGVGGRAFKGKKFKWLIADPMFTIPFASDIVSWLGCESVGKRNMLKRMKSSANIGLIPGGFEEATIFAHDHHRVFIRNRRGFVKYALQHGYKVHPVYSFGEEKTYYAFPYFLNARLWLNKWKIPAVAFFGFLLPFLPKPKVDLVTVVGTGIPFPTISNPTPKDVDQYHTKYVEELRNLFDKHKSKYASNETATMEFF